MKTKKMFDLYAMLSKGRNDSSGNAGEYFAEQLFKIKGWNFEKIPQKILPLSNSMKQLGAKRPDYIIEPKEEAKNSLIFADAKYHLTDDCKKWIMEVSEFKKYDGLINYLKNEYPNKTIYLLFVLFPKECSGNKVVFISFDEVSNAPTEKDDRGKDVKIINFESANIVVEDCVLYRE